MRTNTTSPPRTNGRYGCADEGTLRLPETHALGGSDQPLEHGPGGQTWVGAKARIGGGGGLHPQRDSLSSPHQPRADMAHVRNGHEAAPTARDATTRRGRPQGERTLPDNSQDCLDAAVPE